MIDQLNVNGPYEPGIFVRLPLVNEIRPRVETWREAGHPGVNGSARRLVEHCRDREDWRKPLDHPCTTTCSRARNVPLERCVRRSGVQPWPLRLTWSSQALSRGVT